MATVRGGEKLEKALAKIAAKVQGGTLRVGFLEKSKYPDGTPVGLIAAVQDGGAPARGIPPRPFFRNAIRKNKGDWPKELRLALVHFDYDVDKALESVAVQIEDQIRDEILTLTSPKLKPATVKRKGFDKPLIDDSIMLNSVSHDIQK